MEARGALDLGLEMTTSGGTRYFGLGGGRGGSGMVGTAVAVVDDGSGWAWSSSRLEVMWCGVVCWC